MFFHIPIFFYSLFFLIVVKLWTTDFVSGMFLSSPGKWLFLKSLISLALLFIFYRIAHRISQKANMTTIPLLFVISTTGILYFAQPVKQQQFLILLSTIAYYFIHLALYRLHLYEKDKTAYSIVASGGIATVFLFFCTSFAIYLNYNIPLAVLMLTMMLATTAVSYQYFSLIRNDKKNVINFSLVLGLIMAEISWILNFWPFGYLTTGVIALMFYYVFWDLVQSHFMEELSKKRVVGNMVFLGIFVALVLSSARWLPVI